jgi:hypothetical protein
MKNIVTLTNLYKNCSWHRDCTLLLGRSMGIFELSSTVLYALRSEVD